MLHLRRFGFVIYDGMTVMDFLGAYDALYRIQQLKLVPNPADITLKTCGFTEETEVIGQGLRIGVDIPDAPNLSQFDAVVIAGGLSTRDLMHNKPFIDWIATCHEVTMAIVTHLIML